MSPAELNPIEKLLPPPACASQLNEESLCFFFQNKWKKPFHVIIIETSSAVLTLNLFFSCLIKMQNHKDQLKPITLMQITMSRGEGKGAPQSRQISHSGFYAGPCFFLFFLAWHVPIFSRPVVSINKSRAGGVTKVIICPWCRAASSIWQKQSEYISSAVQVWTSHRGYKQL